MPESGDAKHKQDRKDREARLQDMPGYHYDSHMDDCDDPPVLGSTPFTRYVRRCIGKPNQDEDPDYD